MGRGPRRRIVWHSSKRNEQTIARDAIRSVGLEAALTPWGKDTVVITTDATYGLRRWKLKNGEALADEIRGLLSS